MSERNDHMGPMGRVLAGVNVLAGVGIGSMLLVSLFAPSLAAQAALPTVHNATAILFLAVVTYYFFESAVLLAVPPPAQSRWRQFGNAFFFKFPVLLIAAIAAQAAMFLARGGAGAEMSAGLLWAVALTAGVSFFALLERDDPRTIVTILDSSEPREKPNRTWRAQTGGAIRNFCLGALYFLSIMFFVALGSAAFYLTTEVVRYGREFGLGDLFRILLTVLENTISIGWLWALAFGFVYALPGAADVDDGAEVPDDIDDVFSESQFPDDERAFLTSSYGALIAYMRGRAYPDYFGWDVPLISGITIVGLLLNAPQTVVAPWGQDYGLSDLGNLFGFLALLLSLPLLRRLVSLVLPRYGEYRYVRYGGWRSGLARLHRQLAEDVHFGRLSIEKPFSPRSYLMRKTLGFRNIWPLIGFGICAGLAILFWWLGG